MNERTRLIITPSSGSYTPQYQSQPSPPQPHRSQDECAEVRGCCGGFLGLIIIALAIFSSIHAVIYKNRLDEALVPESVRLRREIFAREEQEHERLKTHWMNEHERYFQDRKNWDIERKQWSEERKREEKKQEEERRKEEERKKEEERRRIGISWDTPYGHECVSYGTRPYNAKVVNVPWNMDPVRVCADMPIEFHGRRVERPLWCERLGVG